MDRLAADQLVGHQHPRHAETAAYLHLLYRRDRDAEGAIIELTGKKLGRHGGFAVGTKVDVVMLEKAAHPAAVMAKGAVFHHQRWKC